MLNLSITLLPLLVGWLLDRAFGDPARLPHPVVGFGRLIAAGERHLNRDPHRIAKGAVLATASILAAYGATRLLLVGLDRLSPWAAAAAGAVLVFYCLAGKTLIDEVREVFRAVDLSVQQGRSQVARIVGRDTESLSAQQVRTAALETLAENLSDGVVAPLFWFALLGVEGMVAYKMVNTLDSMIGYRTQRYLLFGRAAARIDDAANWIPSRLTALLMLLAAARVDLWREVVRFGRCHASPNSGWPEAALAAILGCRFGGTHEYFGEALYKPYIGWHDRELTTQDMLRAVAINRRAEAIAVALAGAAVVLKALAG